MNYSIFSAVYAKLQTVTQLQDVKPFATYNFSGFPAACVEGSQHDNDFQTTNENLRIWQYDIYVHQEISVVGREVGVQLLLKAIDGIVTAFDSDFMLGGQVNIMHAVPGAWGYYTAGTASVIYAKIVVRCEEVKQVDYFGFAPRQLSGLTCWLKSDTGLVLRNNTYVQKWLDQSDAGNHFRQANNNYQPALTLNQLAGLPVVRFDGVNDFLIEQGVLQDLFVDTAMTIFIVFRALTISSPVSPSYNCNQVFSNALHDLAMILDNTPRIRSFADNASTNNHNIALNTWYVYEMRLGGGNIYASLNGNAEISQVCANISGGFEWNIYATPMFLGSGYPGSLPYANVDIGEFICYNRSLSPTEISQIKNYLNGRYAIY
ncbi:MAG: hypothetical protein E6R04_11895 [Spirochaetes bacterium]|nr:MAG: hypothetical protein E6R04_11895 [Spirochaetota bacterium]